MEIDEKHEDDRCDRRRQAPKLDVVIDVVGTKPPIANNRLPAKTVIRKISEGEIHRFLRGSRGESILASGE